MCGEVEIEADTAELAAEKALGPEIPLPTDATYVEDSAIVDTEFAGVTLIEA